MPGNLQQLFDDMRSLAQEQRRLRIKIKANGFQNAKPEKSRYDKNRIALRLYNLAFVWAKKGKPLVSIESNKPKTMYGNTDYKQQEGHDEYPICELCAQVGALLEQYGFTPPYRVENGRKVYDLNTCQDDF